MLILRGLPLARAAEACSEGDMDAEAEATDVEETTLFFVSVFGVLIFSTSFPSSSGPFSPSLSPPPTSLSRQGALRDAEPHDAEVPARGGPAGVEVERRRRIGEKNAREGAGTDVDASELARLGSCISGGAARSPPMPLAGSDGGLIWGAGAAERQRSRSTRAREERERDGARKRAKKRE
jgi:hypothetical protein